MSKVRTALLYLLAVLLIGIGIQHFVNPPFFVKIVPPFLPWPLALVYLSGAAEITLGAGLLPKQTRRLAGWGCLALFVAVFPANIYSAVYAVSPTPEPVAPWILWARLPFQALFVAWAWWVAIKKQDEEVLVNP